VGEIAPFIVIDKMNGAMILDVGLEKLTYVEPRVLNQSADRSRIHRQEVDESQVIDLACDLKIMSGPGWGGARVARKGYTLDAK